MAEAEVPLRNPTTGEIRMVPREGVQAFQEQTGWHVATEEQRETEAQNLESGSAGQQALATGEQVVRTGTFGLAPGLEGWEQREQVLERKSPFIKGAAQAAGAIAPALLGGAALRGAAGLAGLGARGAGLAAAAGEGVTGGLADEIEQARYESRDVSLGNVMLYGLGGELVGRALPHAFSLGAGKIRRALTGAEAAAGEGLTDALVGVEERALRSQADLAPDLPMGSAERKEALRATAPQQYDRMAQGVATDLDDIASLTGQMSDSSAAKRVVQRIRDSLPEESAAQMDWVTGAKRKLAEARDAFSAPLEREAPPSIDEYLGGIKNEAARKKAFDEITDEVIKRAKERGLEVAGQVPAELEQAALDYANDAARRRLRGVADHTKDAGLDALAGEIGPRSAAMEALPDPVKLAINRRTGLASLEDVKAWARDADALRSGHGLGISPEVREARMKKVWDEVLNERVPPETLKGKFPKQTRQMEKVLNKGLSALDEATDIGDQYLIARQTRADLQAAAKGLEDKGLRSILEDASAMLDQGLRDKSLFGGAAELESDLGLGADKIKNGRGLVDSDLGRKVGDQVAFDPKKLRSFLQGDAIDRKLSQGQLEQVLEGAEELAAAHERHGTWPPEQIEKLRGAVGRVRGRLALADEIQAVKAEPLPKAPKAEKTTGQQVADAVKNYAVGRAAGAAGAAAGGLIGGPVGAALGWGVGEVAQSIGKRLVGLDQAARSATKQVARDLAGVGLGYAERAAGRASQGLGGGVLASAATTALSRFTGDYPDPQASFEAKRKILEQHDQQPEVLYETLGSALGDLPKVRPDLFQAIAQRTSQKLRFVKENLPPGLQASLLYPNGTPPSQSDLRDFATLWNTVWEPETVLHDLRSGSATQQQMAILKQSDPDLYDQLRGDIVEMVGANFQHVPTSTKVQLDLLLGADGLAGPIYSSDAARFVGDAIQTAKAQGVKHPPPEKTKAPAQATPSGISAIQTSVTNRQAA